MAELDPMTPAERSCLMFLETCAVDHGGLVDPRQMNEDDHAAAARFESVGLGAVKRIPAAILRAQEAAGSSLRRYTHFVELTPEGFALAHKLRVERAAKKLENGYPYLVRDALRQAGKIPA